MHLDLNLLTALDALLEENSVAAAAERLHLSAPAVSRTLARIRYATGDDILVRTGRTMVPTPYALAIREEVRAIVRQGRALLKPTRELDLQSLDRVFSLRGNDALISALARPLIAALAQLAPHVSVRFLAETAAESSELARGQVDLELGAAAPALPEIASETLGVDRLVVAFRRGHPLASRALTLKRFAQASHVTVSRRGRLKGPIDDVLAAQGLRRRVVASLPTSVAALEVAARSDLLAVVPETVCRPLVAALRLATRAAPLELPPSPVVLAWHQRHSSDPAHAFMREQIRRALSAALRP